MIKITRLREQEQGIVSILITLFLMLIITLIVIGFAKLIRREQRQVLDRQLSTQAFYAAESGVNDARAVLKSNPSAAKPNCDNTGADAGYAGLAPQLDVPSGVAYTCLTVDPSPSSLEYDTIDTNNARTIPITASANAATITLSWQASPVTNKQFTDCPNGGAIPPVLPVYNQWTPSSNCDAGILRIDLVPAATLSRAALSNGLTAFLYPANNGTPNSFTSFAYASASGDSNAGKVIAGNCNPLTGSTSTPRLCNATIDVSALGTSKFYLHAISIYKPNSLSIIVKDGTGGVLSLTGAQALVDATGKASDVLRRIAVRLDTAPDDQGIPIGAIESSTSICKRFSVIPGRAPTDESAAFNGGTACSL